MPQKVPSVIKRLLGCVTVGICTSRITIPLQFPLLLLADALGGWVSLDLYESGSDGCSFYKPSYSGTFSSFSFKTPGKYLP